MSYHNANNQNYSTQNLNSSIDDNGYRTPLVQEKPRGKSTSKWLKFGIPIAILVIVGLVVGLVVGLKSKKDSSPAAQSSAAAAASSASVNSALQALATGRFATATNSLYMVPIYPQVTDTAVFTTPTFAAAAKASLTWPSDTFSAAAPAATSVRPDRPRLIAPQYKWNVLASHIAADPYLTYWNQSIFGNATEWYNDDPIAYFNDGGNGILDLARRFKQRAKAFSYAYRMTNDTKWVDRLWVEIQNVAGNTTGGFGPDPVDKWNSIHFLDTAEFSAGYGIAYDWLYDVWSADQKSKMLFTLNQYGLSFGVNAFSNGTIGWWSTNTTGNWNCVCNGGLTLASLAVLGDDTTGNAAKLLGLTVNNAVQNCAAGPTSDGTWSETQDYWYFGTTGYAEMTSALLTATGSDYGMINDAFSQTGYSHMYGQGPTQLFAVGDTGPNKFSSTANSMFFFASTFNHPELALYQRDQYDAPDPWSMFWYDASVQGAFWDGLPLDRKFDNEIDQWVSMRNTWSNTNGTFLAMKAGMNQGRQTHNDLDCGDFVIQALGHTWAGELGDGNYNALDYFSNDTQNSVRWYYYRKMTEGQNTILVNKENQNVLARPTVLGYGTTNDTQGSSSINNVAQGSTAFWYADITSAYFTDTSSLKRGIRYINNRTQMLVQDEITTTSSFQWRMHTNATVSVSSDGTSATLTIDNDKMTVSILSPSSGAKFSTSDAVRFPTDPIPPEADQPNPNVTVLIIAMDAGTYSLQVLFSPQWTDGTPSVKPPSVAFADWTLTSHDV
ncbi:chondroitin AC/alginate lyase [Rhodocollybia butyracea]|uniref:Chondroitin AC/alginate lyase n=1 Tax=Rhodocollybia butyracea TaxID=206335 RepID=A0A9P5U5Z1_9AGAR|nr:chondroitin AC/alginate lyase [Rhodocollybia butyracea]